MISKRKEITIEEIEVIEATEEIEDVIMKEEIEKIREGGVDPTAETMIREERREMMTID